MKLIFPSIILKSKAYRENDKTIQKENESNSGETHNWVPRMAVVNYLRRAGCFEIILRALFDFSCFWVMLGNNQT